MKKTRAGDIDARQQIRQALTGRGRGRLKVLEKALADGTAIDPQLLKDYVDALGEPYGDLVRLIATRILPAFGASAAKELRPRLDLKGKAVDGWALVAFALADRKQGVKTCRQALQEGSPAVQRSALLALGELSPDEAREGAAAVLQRRASLSQRRTAIEILRQVGVPPAAVPPLVRELKDSNSLLLWMAMEVLKSGGRAAAEELVPLLADKDSQVRRYAAWSLGGIGPEATSAIPGLCTMLWDADDFNCACAAASLGAIGPHARDAVDDLELRTGSAEPVLTVAIAGALFKITGDAKAALALLEPALLSPNIHARRDAALALEAMGSAALPAAPTLVRVLGDRSLHVRHFAGPALAAIGYDPAAVVPLLIGMLDDTSEYFEQQAAIEALGRYGPAARVALPALEAIGRRKRSKYIHEPLGPALAAIRAEPRTGEGKRS